jgi:hypothetical protein
MMRRRNIGNKEEESWVFRRMGKRPILKAVLEKTGSECEKALLYDREKQMSVL